MIVGAHAIIYSKNSDADRAFLRDVLGFPHVDVGEGWLIFGLPPSEVAVHPADDNGTHELYLMCDDVDQFCAEMARRGVATAPVQNQGWGLLTDVALPGGGKLGVYQPRPARPAPPSDPRPAKKASKKPAAAKRPAARKATKKPAKKAAPRRR